MLDSIYFGILGLIVGSFLNVLVLRWGERPLTGRSACAACGRGLAWYDLVPILSWILLRGRCRSCGSNISIQYPLVEALTALVFAIVGFAPLPLYLRLCALLPAALLIAIAVYDLRTMLIPDAWAWTFNALALLFAILFNVQFLMFDLIAGPATALPLFALWFFSRGRWMGFGDVKLTLGMGWLLGWEGGFQALFLAFVLGALVSLPLLFFSSSLWKRLRMRITPREASQGPALAYTMKSEVPFGPFLITSCLLLWFAQMYSITIPSLLIFG